MVGAFFMPGEICFLCPFLRKEVSTVANRIMGITVEIGAILAIFPERGQKVPPLSLFGGEKRPTYNKQRVQGKSYLLEQHLDGDISNAYLAVNLRDSDRRVGGRDIQNTDKGGAGKQWIKNLQ